MIDAVRYMPVLILVGAISGLPAAGVMAGGRDAPGSGWGEGITGYYGNHMGPGYGRGRQRHESNAYYHYGADYGYPYGRYAPKGFRPFGYGGPYGGSGYQGPGYGYRKYRPGYGSPGYGAGPYRFGTPYRATPGSDYHAPSP